jgi:predicted aspartyl protease
VSQSFNTRHGPILIDAEVTGPKRTLNIPLILDTGATSSLLKESDLLALGYDMANVTNHVQMITESTVVSVPKVVLTRLTALGQSRFGFPVLAYTLPASTGVSGLLGLDFLRGQVLTIDFTGGRITLA